MPDGGTFLQWAAEQIYMMAKVLHSSAQDVWKVALAKDMLSKSLPVPIHSGPCLRVTPTILWLWWYVDVTVGQIWIWGWRGQGCGCLSEAEHVEQTWCSGLESTQRPHADRTWPPRSWIKGMWNVTQFCLQGNQSSGRQYHQWIRSTVSPSKF